MRLEARELVFDHPGPLRAVDGVSLCLEPGELVCVLGPNGAGKSTLLRLFAGLLTPSAGHARLDDVDVCTLDPRVRARSIALVPQWLVRVPDVRVEDFVLGGRYGHLDPWRRTAAHDHRAVSDALAAAHVEALRERPLTSLSGGQRRRVLVARSLAQAAQFLLVDEPTSDLDPEHQLAIFELLLQLARAGRGVLVVTHDLNLASRYATRLVLLQSGRTAAEGDAAAVLDPAVLAGVYRAPFRTGAWPAGGDGTRPFAVPWNERA